MIAPWPVRVARRPLPWRTVAAVGATVLVAGIVAGHLLAAARPAAEATPLVVATHLYALLLTAGLLWLAAALGRVVLRSLGVAPAGRLEAGIFAVAVGLGLLAYGTLLLGLAQQLSSASLAVGVGLLALLLRRDLSALVREAPAAVAALVAFRGRLRRDDRALALLVPIAELLVLALLVQALAPPTANDALTYHLLGPRRFLELGGLAPLPDVQQVNMPLAVNMLYLLGLAFGSDEQPAVVHLALALLVAAAAFSFGRRFWGERVGWVAATTFVATQLMLVFATVPYVDYGLSLFDFLAVYAFVVWWRSGRARRPGWLVACGLLVGSALGSKLLGAITALALGLWLVGLLAADRRSVGWRGAAASLLAYGLPALLLAGPWYLKNLAWFGNPVWPFLAGNPHDFNMYLGGTTRFADSAGLLGALSLPLRLYADGSVEYPAIRPPLVLLVLPLYAVVRRHAVASALLVLAGVQCAVWSQGAHLLRYLLAALPGLCLVAAYVVVELRGSPRVGRVARPLTGGLLLVGLLFPTVIAAAVVLVEGKPAQLVGLESRAAYLGRSLDNHRLVEYLNSDAEPIGRVLTIGDNRTFYLRRPTWVDVSLEQLQLLAGAPDASAARRVLAEHGVTHVLVNTRDLAWYAPFDADGRLRRWTAQFDAGRGGYLEPVLTNEASTLYRVTAEPPANAATAGATR